MYRTLIPASYKSILDIWQTEKAIKFIKETFQTELAGELKLRRITAPLLVESGTGLNDNLSGTELPVRFSLKTLEGKHVEIVQSLAKWKRYALWRHHIEPGMGIYTDMNAIRPPLSIRRPVGLGKGNTAPGADRADTPQVCQIYLLCHQTLPVPAKRALSTFETHPAA